MPINKEAYIRYRIIDACLRDKYRPYPSMDVLIQVCEEKLGKTFSESTIQKDIKAMREDPLLGYEAPIRYDKRNKGYCYTDPAFTISAVPLNENDIQAIEFAATLLQQFQGIQMFEEFDSAVDKIFNSINIHSVLEEEEIEQVVQFEKVPYFQGSEHLGPLLQAVKDRKPLRFSYRKYFPVEQKEHLVHPYLLKEFRNRWYLIGMDDEKGEIRTYGLDRMSQIEVSDVAYRYHAKFDARGYFEHAYGITAFEGEPEEVVLSFTPFQGNYIKTQPLHETQQVLSDDDQEFRVSLRVGVTHELIRDILAFGSRVRVVKPAGLIDAVRSEMAKAISLYPGKDSDRK